jgi:hypothetical protein
MFAEMLKVPYQDNPSNGAQMGFTLAGTDKSEKYMAYGHRAFTVKHNRS